MPYAADRTARLFYDDSCGPCTLLARAAEGVSHHHVVATPLAAPAADPELGRLSPEARYGYAHLATDGTLLTGEAIATPLVGLAIGPALGRLVRRAPPIDRSLRWLYGRLWEYRRAHGCGARVQGSSARRIAR